MFFPIFVGVSQKQTVWDSSPITLLEQTQKIQCEQLIIEFL